jgi:hypothetical protein
MAGAETKGLAWFWSWASGLRFPGLLVLTVALFLLDLVIPDLIPFVDEILLGLLALLLGSIRKRRAVPTEAGAKTIDVDPVESSAAPPDERRD